MVAGVIWTQNSQNSLKKEELEDSHAKKLVQSNSKQCGAGIRIDTYKSMQ